MDVAPHILLLVLCAGRVTSWFVYNSCWWFSHPMPGNPYAGDTSGVLLLGYLKKWWWLWGPIAAVSFNPSGWGAGKDEQMLRILISMQAAVLAWKGVFRFGAVDQLRFYVADRCLAGVFAVLTYYHPVFFGPSLLASSILTYSISSWPIAPPYSNYLGNEFIRFTAAHGLCCLLFKNTLLSGATFGATSIVVVATSQVEYYFHQGFGKVRLGDKPWDWLLQNRGECILVNSYLRGWNRHLSKDTVLRLADVLKRLRLMLGAGALAAELGGVVSASVPWYLLAAGFHGAVFIMTGILVWENVLSHLTMCYIMYHSGMLSFTCLNLVLVGYVLASEVYVVALEKLLDYDKVKALMLFDSAYLLMCWWDSPYMRMYTYEATTDKGTYAFPVTLFSPYDTFITDIHTRMSYFKMHTGLDRQRSDDLETVHSGVWGLLLYKHEAMRMYRMMDGRESKDALTLTDDGNKWSVGKADKAHPAYPFLRFIAGFNEYQSVWWFRAVMKWPHFPGEDMVPDVLPSSQYEMYNTSHGQIQTLTIRLVKTFYTGADIELLDKTTVGVVNVPPVADVRTDDIHSCYRELSDFTQMLESTQRGGR